MPSKNVKVTIVREGSMCVIPVPFDPEAVFGKVRARVRVTLNGYTYRSTICRMSGSTFVPLRKSNREAARIEGGETVQVRFESDTDARTVQIPADLEKALRKQPHAWKGWQRLSYTHQKESVESVLGAKRPETRERRISKAVSLAVSKSEALPQRVRRGE